MKLKSVILPAVIAVIAAGAVGIFGEARHAQATIHEGPIASWCSLLASGNFTPLNPPGLSGRGSEHAIARPLLAAGMITVTPFDADGDGDLDGVLIAPDESHPAVKTVVVDGEPIQIEPGVWLQPFMPDPDFPAFQHCPNLP